MSSLLPDEDKNFGRSLVLDFRKRWRHVKTIYSREQRIVNNYSPKWRWLAVDIREFTKHDGDAEDNVD